MGSSLHCNTSSNQAYALDIASAIEVADVNVAYYASIGSTNDYLLSLPKSDAIQICLADEQTKGKGRLGRVWHSPAGQNIYLSLRLSMHQPVSALGALSLAVGLAAIKSIETLYRLPKPLKIKWPNDIYYEDQKLAGILVETKSNQPDITEVVIGVGINVNMVEGPDNAWQSLKNIIGYDADRQKLTITLIDSLLQICRTYEKGLFDDFIKLWAARDYLEGKSIKLKSQEGLIQGVAKGITKEGLLEVALDTGDRKQYSSGEITTNL